jgi:hypothetical protein
LLLAFEVARKRGRPQIESDLRAFIRRMKLKKAGPANFLAYLPFMYYRSILNGEGKLDELMNHR